MLLHGLYVDSPGGAGAAMAPPMALALSASFGSVERWREEFFAMGQALGRTSGCVVLGFQPRDGTLVNQWAADGAHMLDGSIPVLVLGMHAHADHIDFGAQAGPCADALMANTDWAKVHQRYQHAVHAVGDALGATQDDAAETVLVDVRRAGAYEQAKSVLPGATWHDPAHVASWADGLPRDRHVVVYCVHGHEVSRVAAMQLRARGIQAHFLLGGFDGWQAAGRPLEPKR